MGTDPVPETRVDAQGRRWVRTSSGFVPEPPLDEPLPAADEIEPFRRPSFVAPAPRWVAPLFIALAVLLVPWTVLLALTLPPHHVSSHYREAWVGFDVMLFAVLAMTGWNAYRRSTWVEVTAAMAATMLVVDAWFDVLTSGSGWQLVDAIVSAVVVELPLAALALWLARHAAAVTERSTMFLLMRSQRQARKLRERAVSSGADER